MLLVACCIASFSFISWLSVSLSLFYSNFTHYLHFCISCTCVVSILSKYLSPHIFSISAFLHSPSSPHSSLRGQKTKVRGWVRQITMEIEKTKKKRERKKESERASAPRAQVLMLTSSPLFFRVQYQQSTIRTVINIPPLLIGTCALADLFFFLHSVSQLFLWMNFTNSKVRLI